MLTLTKQPKGLLAETDGGNVSPVGTILIDYSSGQGASISLTVDDGETEISIKPSHTAKVLAFLGHPERRKCIL